jgi:hypothetical protein
MEEKNFIVKLFDNYASKTLLALFGLIGTIITIYAFFEQQNVDLRYEVIANTNVLDFNADLNNLEVLYDSTNLKQTKENLRIFTIRVINNGNKPIIKEFYDENDPVGLMINTGTLVEKPEIIKTSNDYIKRTLKVANYSNKKISFTPIIIEPDEYFIIKLLVLHKKGTSPKIFSLGKVAGQKDINVVNSIDIKEQPSFIKTTYSGNIWVQLLRLLTYILIAVIILAIIISTSEKIDEIRDDKRKKKTIKDFKQTKNYSYTRMDDAIFDRYLQDGFYILNNINKLIDNDIKLNAVYNKLSEQMKSKEFKRFRRTDENGKHQYYDYNTWKTIKSMINDGIVIQDNNSLSVNLSMKETLSKFIDYNITNGDFKNHSSGFRDFKSFEEPEYDEDVEKDDIEDSK